MFTLLASLELANPCCLENAEFTFYYFIPGYFYQLIVQLIVRLIVLVSVRVRSFVYRLEHNEKIV